MFGSKQTATVDAPLGRYYSETVESTLSTPKKHGRRVEQALNAGTEKGWVLQHITSAPVSTTSVFTILVWDTEGQ